MATFTDPASPDYFLDSFPRDAFPRYAWTERSATLPQAAWTTETTHRDGQQGGLPLTAALVEGNARDGDLLGVLKLRYGFREAAGPGFALVGDSGLHKDPTPGYGITDALRDARNLAKAILSGTDDALLRYWRQRDVDSIDLFHFARDMGDPSYVNPLNRLVYEHAARSPDLMARLQAQANREISPYEVVQLGTLLKLMGGALLRGNFSVLPAFFAAGKRGATVEKERKERVGLLGAMGPAPA